MKMLKLLEVSAYWGGKKEYNPEKDVFYRKLITKINEKNLVKDCIFCFPPEERIVVNINSSMF